MSQVSAGWYPDPTRKFETRYWDGTQWTEYVARAGQAARDPLMLQAEPTSASVQQTPSAQDQTSAADPTGTLGAANDAGSEPAEPAGWDSAVPPPPPPVQQPPYGTPLVSPPMQATVAGLAIASMVLGILWIYWLGSVLAIIFGHIALSQIKKSNGWKTGRGMAIAGVVLGYVGMATLVLVIVLAIAASNNRSRFRIDTDPANGVCNTKRFLTDPDC